ncbi:M56 family metallopeptidase [Novosphingobium tardum]|uniref:M56 family metallopeptidase n=1 Tax=Novosphingobium tardum TaxID=1538021 RepID=A0ABV8RP13_9SPHN
MIAWIVQTLWVTAAMIAVVLVLRRPVARLFGPGFAYALWALPLVRFVLPPIVLPAAFAPQSPVEAASTVTSSATMVIDATGGSAAAEAASYWPSLQALLIMVWLGGAALFLWMRWRGYHAMRRDLLADARLVDKRDGVRIVETPGVAAPVAFGWRDKVVALPPEFLITGHLVDRALALEHELAHHRGHDLLANFAAQPLLALHWFNPLAWAAWEAMRRDQEAACDARAMRGRDLATRARYARVIASFACAGRGAAPTTLAAPMACPVLGDKSIIHRLRSLTMTEISPRRRRLGRWGFIAAGVLALPLTATISYASQDAPPVPPVPLSPPASVTAPPAPAAPRRIEQVIIEHVGVDHAGHDKDAKFSREMKHGDKTIRIVTSRPLSDAEFAAKVAEIEANPIAPPMPPEPPMPPAVPSDKREIRRIVMHGDGAPGAMALAIDRGRCEASTLADAMADATVDEGGKTSKDRTRVLICGKPGEGKAQALAAVRRARERMSAKANLPDSVRAEVLRQLDESIARLEKEG